MARKPRLALQGRLHHVVQRGHNGQAVFLQDQDRLDYLAMLQEAAREQGVAVHAFALHTGEVHLLVTPERPESLGRLMQSLGRRYVSSFNRRHGRSGTLWNGRFRSSVLAPSLLTPATVVIECSAPIEGEGHAWTSAPHHLGQHRSALIVEHPEYWKLGNTPFERELAHANLLRDGVDAALMQQMVAAIQSAGVVGDAAFRHEIALATGHVMEARPRGRPARSPSG